MSSQTNTWRSFSIK